MSPEISVEIEIWCACGVGLCNQTTDSSRRGKPSFTVDPCDKCLDKARQEGYDKGYDRGDDDGYRRACQDAQGKPTSAGGEDETKD